MTSSDLWDREAAEAYDEHSRGHVRARRARPDGRRPRRARRRRPGARARGRHRPCRGAARGARRRRSPASSSPSRWSGQLRDKVDDDIPVVLGDMATTHRRRARSPSSTWSSTPSRTCRTQAAQVACFRNAARHLAPGGSLRRRGAACPTCAASRRARRLCPSASTDAARRRRPLRPRHASSLVSHHYLASPTAPCDLRLPRTTATSGPSELRPDGAPGRDSTRAPRSPTGTGAPFTGDSASHVSVWRKPDRLA